MKKLVAFFALLLVVFAVSFSGTKTSPVKPTTRQQRVVIANSWLDGMNKLYALTKDETISKYLQMISEKGVLTEPTEGGFIPQRNLKIGDFPVIPLTNQDTFSPWGNIYKRPELAAFYQVKLESGISSFVVIKNGELFSDITRGIILSHEMQHVEEYIGQKNPVYSEETRCKGEVNAHTFSNSLFLKIGGAPYQKLLNRRTEEVTRFLIDKNSTMPSAYFYSNSLDKIFGKPVSTQEKDARLSAFEIGSIFLAVDKNYPGIDKENEKARLYCLAEKGAKIANQ